MLSERRSALVLICVFGTAVSTAYTSHGPLLGLIRAEFGVSSADVGAIATAYFGTSAITVLLAGAASAVRGPRVVVTFGFGAVAVTGVLMGLFTPSFGSLLAWRALGGMGSGLAFAAGAHYITLVFAGRGAHLAQGLYGASFLVGSGSTLVLMPIFAGADQDWRRAYLLLGIGVFAAWLAWTLFAPSGPRGSAARQAGLRVALRHRNTWLLGLTHMCGFGLAMVLGTWATLYVQRTFGLPLAVSGAFGSIVLVTGIAARSAGGAILERGVLPVRLIQGSLALAALGLLLMAAPLGWLPLAVAGLVVTGFGIGLPYAAVFNGASASVPESSASAQAFVGWSALVVAVLGPPVVGGLLDATGSFAAGFGVLAAFTLAVLLATTLLRPFSFARPPRREAARRGVAESSV